ncbi:MAG: tetratricopeptide repeat protein [Cyclobacteriaceae bacterium]|nr:tetratricopeptide repeat protein [Cyclobacteriaceae bacterium]
MKRISLVFLVQLSIFNLVVAQNDWVNQYNQAQEAYNSDELENASTLGKQCLDTYLKQSGEIDANYRSILRLLSTVSFELSQFNEGIEFAEKEISVLEQMASPKDLTYAGALYNLGVMYQQLENYDKALETLEQTLTIYTLYYSSGDEEMVNCQWKIATIQFSKGNAEVSGKLFNDAFTAFGSPEEITMDYLQACYYYGNLLMEQGDSNGAIQYLSTVKTIYEDAGYEDSEEYLNVVSSMANVYRKVDKEEAERLFESATNIYESVGNKTSSEYTNLLNNRAVNLQELGKTQEAEKILSSIGEDQLTGQKDVSSLNNLAALSQQRGDNKKAEELYLQAMKVAEDKSSYEYAEVLENIAVLYSTTERLEEARNYLVESNGIIVSLYGEEHERYASTLRKQALVDRQLHNYEKAEEYYKRAVEITTKADNTSLLSLQCSNGLAVLYKELGRYNEADDLFTSTVSTAKKIAQGNSNFYALVLNNQAALKEIKGEHFQARNLLQESLGVSESSGKTTSNTYLGTLENLSAIYIELGEYENARSILEKSKKIIEKKYGKNSTSYAANVLNFGRLEQSMGQYPIAEPHFKEAMELSRQNFGDQHPEYARSLNAMALFYQLLGNISEAEPLLLESANIYENMYGKSHPEYITTIENLSSLYQMKGENDKAMPLLQEALKMDALVYGEDHPVFATTLHNLASLYQKLERYSESEPLFVKALKIDERVNGKHHRSYANTLYNLGTLYQDLGKYEEAEEAFKEALEIRKILLGENHPDYAYSLYGLASLYHGTRKFNEAYTYYSQVIKKYTEQIDEYFPSMSEKEKSAFYSKIKPVFDAFFDFCIEYQFFENRSSNISPIADMYNLQLSTKALLLNASNKVRNRIMASGNQELIKNYREWMAMKERLVKYLNYTQEELQSHNIDIGKIKLEANELEKKLSTQSHLFAQQFEKNKNSWSDVRDYLKEDEAAIEMIRVNKKFMTDSVLYVGLIVTKKSNNEPDVIILNDGNKLENRLYKYYRNAIKFSIGNEISYNNYWKEIREKIEGVKRLYFSADGIYNKININTLWDPTTQLSVIDELEVRFVSNTRELLEESLVSTEVTNNAEIFGFPDFNVDIDFETVAENSLNRTTGYGFKKGISPLPGTKVEVESIQKMLIDNKWENNVNTALEAREEKIKSIMSPRLLHIASHGFFMNDISFDDQAQSFEVNHNDLNSNPLLRSGVLLTGSAKAIILNERGAGEDGILTAYEAMNLNLDNTELVVLSACETGLGEVRNGEGVYGLQRSFIVAGAKNVIMSLWKVNDVTTQELMSSFYSNWLEGMDKFEAFKQAQLEIKSKYDDPYHWGAFVLLGK